ncbi:MAG: ATP-binding protein [Rhizonema sp. NSF051]|nr:ATP-binding protein [Rhizonema sp. NSF051]
MHTKEPITHQLEAQTPQSIQKTTEWDESGRPVQMMETHKDLKNDKSTPITPQQAKRDRLLSSTLKRIHSCSRLETILQTVVEDVRQFLQTDHAIIFSFDSQGDGAVAFESAAEGLTSLVSIANKDLNWSHCKVTQEFEENIPNASHTFREDGVKASLAIPIVLKEDRSEVSDSIENSQSEIQNSLWGLLIVHDERSYLFWQDWEIECLKQISIQIAIAIKQSQLFERVQIEVASRQFAEARSHEKSHQSENALSELKYVQEQLLQNEKMANLGQLVADMVHEINNPLNFIHGTLHPANQYAEELIQLIELYQHRYPTSELVKSSGLQRLDIDFMKTDFLKLLWSMQSGFEHIKEIVLALQNFSRFDDNQMRKFDMHEGLNSVVRILQNRLKERLDRPGIQVIKEFGNLPLVECYPGEINQVFMNILTNAIDALEERMKVDHSFPPQILIRTEIISRHLSLVSNNQSRKSQARESNKHKVVIRISDNGKGILPHVQRHIFEPFFTTKQDGRKGIGLSISEKIIVEKHQGKLKCNSRIGQGTEFVIEMNSKAKHYADIRKHASF